MNDSAEYWGPYMNTIYVTWFTTSEALVEATVNGYVQFDSGGVGNVQQYNQLQPYTTSGLLAINISAANSFGYIGFNTNVGLTSNVHFRRALQHLTNYATETQALDNGILGIASPYYLYPAIYGSYFGSQEAAAYQQHGAFSLTAAEQELEAAGLVDNSKGSDWTFANGTAVPALNVLTSTGPGLELEEASIEAMTDNAAAINLTINIEPVNFYTIIDSLLPSGSFQMYFLGWSLGTPVSPTWFYYIFGDYPLNTYYQNFQNTTMWNEFNDLLEGSSTQALAQQYATTSADELQNQLPYIILDWGTSLTPVNVQSWKGYTLEAPYGVLFPGEVHPTGSTFGSLYRFGTPQNPDTLNLYVATSLYDFQILNLLIQTPLTIAYNDPVGIVANAAYNYSIGSLDGKDPNGHPVNGTTITMNFNPNVYFSDGVPLTAADYNFTLWWLDMGGFSSNPWNPSQDTVTIDPGVVLNYTAESANPALEYFGEAAGFVDSYVPPSNPYQLTIYFNTTSIFNLNEVYSEPILPEHIFASISPTAFASETTGQYLAQEVFAGSYTLNSYSPANSYAELQYNPAAFLASPLAVQMNAVTGSTAAFSMTADTWNGPGMTSSSSGFFGDYVPINGASGTLYVMNPTTLATIASYPLTAGSNGQYTAQIPTGSLAIGSYTLDAQLSWTGPSYTDFAGGQTTGNTYYYHQYSTLNVTPVVSTTTTTSQSSVATISTASFSSSFSTTSAPIITTTSGAPTTTTTTSSNSAEYLVLAIIIVAVVIMIVALIARRGPKSSAPASNTATM
ncbi:MAG TPA: ABC transporter substrate-binding protein [Nitrososphaerales archaeon]|nr:ABC transporter substrate-binding protein [Nitrososphaerales archaeon]